MVQVLGPGSPAAVLKKLLPKAATASPILCLRSIVYEKGSKKEAFEWYNIRNANKEVMKLVPVTAQ